MVLVALATQRSKGFDSDSPVIELTGLASTYATPRGVTRIRMVTSDGKVFFTDCLAIPVVCTGSSGFSHSVKVSAFFASGAPIFWPVSVVNTNGRTVVTAEASRQMYALFIERDGSLYRFPLALAAAFVVFAIWFGKRPAIG